MALTATATRGFERVRNLSLVPVNPNLYELTPNTAFVEGDMVVDSAGKIAKAAANATNVRGVMAASYTTAENPSNERTFGLVWDHPQDVFRCTFSDQQDSTATSGSTTTLADTTLTTTTDNYWNGASLYVYDGAAKGTIRTVSAYTNASRTFTFVDAAYEAIGATSKYIVLGAALAAGDVINVGKIGVDLKDENTIDGNATVASEAGPLECLAIYPNKLQMDVRIKKHIRA